MNGLENLVGVNSTKEKVKYLGVKGAIFNLLGKSEREIIFENEELYTQTLSLVKDHYKSKLDSLLDSLEKYEELTKGDNELTLEEFDRISIILANIVKNVNQINTIFFKARENLFLLRVAGIGKEFDIQLQKLIQDGFDKHRETFQMKFSSFDNYENVPTDLIQKNDITFMLQTFAGIDCSIMNLTFLLESSYNKINETKLSNKSHQSKIDAIAIELNNCMILLEKIYGVMVEIFGYEEDLDE